MVRKKSRGISIPLNSFWNPFSNDTPSINNEKYIISINTSVLSKINLSKPLFYFGFFLNNIYSFFFSYSLLKLHIKMLSDIASLQIDSFTINFQNFNNNSSLKKKKKEVIDFKFKCGITLLYWYLKKLREVSFNDSCSFQMIFCLEDSNVTNEAPQCPLATAALISYCLSFIVILVRDNKVNIQVGGGGLYKVK